jgi:hypothetical protein
LRPVPFSFTHRPIDPNALHDQFCRFATLTSLSFFLVWITSPRPIGRPSLPVVVRAIVDSAGARPLIANTTRVQRPLSMISSP